MLMVFAGAADLPASIAGRRPLAMRLWGLKGADLPAGHRSSQFLAKGCHEATE